MANVSYLCVLQLFPSFCHVISCACLSSLALLSLQQPPQSRAELCNAIRAYTRSAEPLCIRKTAWKCLLQIEGSLEGPDRVLSLALESLCQERSQAVQLAIWEELLALLVRFGSKVRTTFCILSCFLLRTKGAQHSLKISWICADFASILKICVWSVETLTRFWNNCGSCRGREPFLDRSHNVFDCVHQLFEFETIRNHFIFFLPMELHVSVQVRGKKGVTCGTVQDLYRTMINGVDAHTWHFAFLLFMVLNDEPPTTYHKHEEAPPPARVSKPKKRREISSFVWKSRVPSCCKCHDMDGIRAESEQNWRCLINPNWFGIRSHAHHKSIFL